MAIYFAWDSGARPFQFDSINDPHQYVLCATGALRAKSATGKIWLHLIDDPANYPEWQAGDGASIANGLHPSVVGFMVAIRS